MLKSLSRYIVTQRLIADSPSNNDPKVKIFNTRYSGMFDIRDSQAGNVICGSTSNLKLARATQARWNSALLGFV